MKFVNPKANEKEFKKVKTKKRIVVSLPIVIALIVGIVLISIFFRGEFFILKIAVMALPLIVGIIIAFILWVYAFNGSIDKNQAGVEVDLESNIAVCDCCGRYFGFSELQFKISDEVTESTTYGERSTVSTYTGSVAVSCECPSCKTRKEVTVQINVGEDTTIRKHDIINDKTTVSTKTIRKTETEIRDKLRNIYDKNMREARQAIKENTNKGYVIDKDQKANIAEKKDKNVYEVFLYGSTVNTEIIADIIKKTTFCSDDEALMTAENGGIVDDYLYCDEAEKLVSELREAGAKTEKKIMR